jgi:hypothetical protein
MAATNFVKHEEMVLEILREVEAARSDDYILFAEVINRFYPNVVDVPLHKALIKHREINLPSYESITRVRRKLQNKYPEYASERTKKLREKMESEYVAYAHT